MTKLRFLLTLRDRLSDLTQDEVEERLHFYSEMIEDRMEEGLSEEEAVSAVGSVDEIAAQITADRLFVPAAGEQPAPKKRRRVWEILLLVLGSPLWITLLLAAAAVAASLYVSLWAVILSLWAVFASAAACAIGGLAAGVVFALGGHGLTGLAMIGASMVCAGLTVFLFFGCRAVGKGSLLLTKKAAWGVKKSFAKGGAQ